jgi:hypothetical protein
MSRVQEVLYGGPRAARVSSSVDYALEPVLVPRRIDQRVRPMARRSVDTTIEFVASLLPTSLESSTELFGADCLW